LPIAGSGVVLLSGAIILISGGILAELVYKLGDIRESDFSRLTVKVWPQSSAGRHPEVSLHG
jgi:hypothetical protein